MNREKINTAKNYRYWDIPAALLLLIILTTGFSRLIATEWTPGLVVTRYIAYIGLIAGLAIGFSRFSTKLVVFLGIVYGLFVIPWRLGMLMGEGILWSERMISMTGRLQVIFGQLAKRQAVTDGFLFLVLMSILFWVLSIHAGYSLTRYAHPWRTIIPTGATLVMIHSYDAYLTSRVWYLVIYLFFSLILVARLVYLHNRSRWVETNTYIPPYIGVDFVRIALAATVVLMLMTFATPALADSVPQAQDVWARLKQPWNELRNTMDNAFASLRSSVGIVSDFYGPSLSLGRGTQLTDRQVLTVLVPENIPDGIRLYWKARSYDHYDNGWSTSVLTTDLVDSNTFDYEFPDSEDNAPGLFPFTFRVASPVSTLLAPHQPVWVSRPVKLELEYNDQGEADLATMRATPPLSAGEIYDVRSSLNQLTVASLQSAGTNYPEWVTGKYLQLPENLTPRTLDLARQLAQGSETPYDTVIAVTNYLRDNIQYSETIPSLPDNQELVDWFLFDMRQGFCNYYATAEIILLRAVGIPARMAVGYAQGEPVEGSNAFVVLQRDAHAWPEVYFPNIGWVEFEPTVSQPTIIRPSGETSTSD
ncbi:MAG: transglutaminase family protein, partial [Anaerolineales bacterium]